MFTPKDGLSIRRRRDSNASSNREFRKRRQESLGHALGRVATSRRMNVLRDGQQSFNSDKNYSEFNCSNVKGPERFVFFVNANGVFGPVVDPQFSLPPLGGRLRLPTIFDKHQVLDCDFLRILQSSPCPPVLP